MRGAKGTTRVLISNDALRMWFFGTTKGRRLSEKRINDLADKMKPIFPRHSIKAGSYGHKYLVLYLNEKDDPSVKTKAVRVFIPSRTTVYEALGIQ